MDFKKNNGVFRGRREFFGGFYCELYLKVCDCGYYVRVFGVYIG